MLGTMLFISQLQQCWRIKTRTNYNDDCIHKHKLLSVGCKYLLRKPATMLNTRTIITLHNIIQMLPMLCVCVCVVWMHARNLCFFGRSFCCVQICSYKNGYLRILVWMCVCVFVCVVLFVEERLPEVFARGRARVSVLVCLTVLYVNE